MAEMTKLQAHLLTQDTETYTAYLNGKMSYALHGTEWASYVEDAFPDLGGQTTSENIFKDVIDLYAQNLIPLPKELRGFRNTVVPLLCRGEAVAVVDPAGEAHFPEHFEVISDGRYTAAAIFTRDIKKMVDQVTFVDSDGNTSLWTKPVPEGFTPATREGYEFLENSTGYTLYRFALDDKGFGPSLAALQDRINHSIIDQTVIAEMYARPFWYLLKYAAPPENPYLPTPPSQKALREQKTNGASGRIFTTDGEGPFGQLNPPTISDMVSYHDSITSKVSQSTGIPEFFFKPGNQVPSGVALKVLSKRYNNKIARIREDIEPQLEVLAEQLHLQPEEGQDKVQFWPSSDDLLQDALDAHGIALTTMGYPLEYIAEVVTPGVDLDDYMDDGFNEDQNLSPDQIAAYRNNPGQLATPEVAR